MWRSAYNSLGLLHLASVAIHGARIRWQLPSDCRTNSKHVRWVTRQITCRSAIGKAATGPRRIQRRYASRRAWPACHERAWKAGETAFTSRRQKPNARLGFTDVPFLYDSDDYRFLPGLVRPHDSGFLTPVFFKRSVLLKYDNAPDYRVQFASTTYGTIYTDNDYISFGINRNGLVVMWLGDIAKLPEAEQYYLRSENVPSDHSLGSEFYDGQIDCIFTERSKEDELFRLRSEFVEECFLRFNEKVAHLDAEVMDLAFAFNPPVVDTPKERRHVADSLNKIYIESFDNPALGRVLSALGGVPKQLGSLKRLQGILELALPGEDIGTRLSPFYVLYDLRVAYSHLHSSETAEETLEKVTARLALPTNAGLMDVYDTLLAALTVSFEALIVLLKR